MILYPSAVGLLVPDPSMQGTPEYFLPMSGREVDWSDYWQRRLNDGDVTTVAPTPAPAPPSPSPAPAP